MAAKKLTFACAMEGQIVGDFLSDAQAALAAFLPKMRGYVCFISDEDSRKLLGILNKFAEKALETKRSSHKTPMKKLEQMNIEDLMKHVQKEKLLIDLVEAEPGTAGKSVKSKNTTTRGGGWGEKKEPRRARERRKEKEDEKEIFDVDQEEIVAPRKRGRPPTKQNSVREKAKKDAIPTVDQQRDQVKPFKKRQAVDNKQQQHERREKKKKQQHEEDKQQEKEQEQERVAWDEDKVSRF